MTGIVSGNVPCQWLPREMNKIDNFKFINY